MSEIGDRLRGLFEEIAPRPDVEGLFAGETPVPHRQRSRLLVAAGLFSVVAVTAGVLFLLDPGSDRTPDAATTLPGAPSTTSLPATTITYLSPVDDDLVALVPDSIECAVGALDIPCAAIFDQDPFTAWTVSWDDDLPIVTMSFGQSVAVSSVGLQNLGDRLEFLRRARIRQIELTTDEGGSVLVDFEDSNLESRGVSVPTLTGRVFTIHVLSVYPPQSYEGQPPLAELSVAELQLAGRTAAGSETGVDPSKWAGDWSYVTLDPSRRGQAVALAFDGDGFALIARMEGGEFLAWESSDGLDWSVTGSLGTGAQLDLVASAEGWVAVGSRDDRATAWVSAGGWHEVLIDTDLGPPGSIATSVAEHRGRLIAVGRYGDPGRYTGGAISPAIWVSDDGGESWRPVDPPDQGSASTLLDVATGPDGLVAFGRKSDAVILDGSLLTMIRSEDGLTWESLSDADFSPFQVDAAFGDATGFVVLDEIGDSIWESPDGSAWSRAALLARVSLRGSMPTYSAPARYQGSVVLAGAEIFDGPDGYNVAAPVVWLRTDQGWAVSDRAPMLGFVYELVSGRDRLVMVGELGPTEEGPNERVSVFVFWPDTQPEALPCTDRRPPLPDRDLPAAVAVTRRAIYQAAVDCDWVALSRLASQGEFLYTVGGQGSIGDPTEYWIERMGQGDDILGDIATVLTLPARQVTFGNDGETEWVWPAIAYKDDPTDADWQALLPLYDQERIGEMRDRDSYEGGFLLQIGGDGRWTFAGRMLD